MEPNLEPNVGRGSSFVMSLGPGDICSLESLVQSAFRWPEPQISSNFTTLFPSATPGNQNVWGGPAAAAPAAATVPAVPAALPSPFAAATAPPAPPVPAPPVPAVVSPFLGLTPLDLLAAAAAADAHAVQAPQPPSALPVPAASPGQREQQEQQQEQLWQQQITMQRAQQELLLQQQQQLVLQQQRQEQLRRQQQQAAAEAAAAAAAIAASATAAAAAAAATGQAASTSLLMRPGWQQVTTALPQAAVAAAAPQAAHVQAQQQQQVAVAGGAAQAAKPPPKRRGRPPPPDGQYSQGYAALKRYRARRREQVQEMEAQVAAKLAQLAALQQENLSLKHRQEALQATISIQDRMVEQLSAMQLSGSLRSSTSEPGAAAAGNGSPAAAAAAAAAGSTPAEQVTALVAALTGERQDNNMDDCDANDVNDATARDRASPFAGLVNTALNNAGAPSPDWAGITAAADTSQAAAGPAAAAAADQAPFQLPLEVQQLHVPALLGRYRAYVAEAAAALTALAAALAAARPGEFPLGQPVPPSAVGRVLPPEAAAQLGVRLPPAPFSLPEFLALGNDERIPPALPAINLLTGQHESIQPEIWRVVAGQISLRPGQRERLAAAWELYAKSLEQVNEERSGLMARLQQALETSDRLSEEAAAVAAAASGGGSSSAKPGGAGGVSLPARALTDASVVDALLSTAEYYSLSEAIDANMAREDGIMILFDWAIGSMLDDLQRCQVVVSSWPFFPLMGSICAGLLGVADE